MRHLPRFLSAFEQTGFGPVWLSILAANSGRFCIVLVAGYQAFHAGHSAVWSSAISMVILLPMVVVAPLAGGLADRINRALLMAVGMGLALVAAGIATVLTAIGAASLPALVALVLLIGAGGAVQAPAWQSILPGVLGTRRLLNGSLLAQIAQQGAELSGPAIGTAVVAVGGPVAGFGLCAVFYAVGMVTAWRVRGLVGAPGGHHRGLFRPVLEGLDYVLHRPTLALLMLFVALHCSLTMAFNGLLPALAAGHLHGGSGVYGLLLTSVGVGAVAGPLLIMLFGRRLRDVHVLFVTGFSSGATLALLGVVPSLGLAVPIAAAVGASESTFMAVVYMLSQTMAEDHMRGRVSSSQLVITAGSMSILSMGWGALEGPWGPGLTLVVPGVAFVLAVLGFLPCVTRFDVRGVMTAGAPAAGG
ncbi:MAG: MFS transporter [Candidatus Dormibacteraeota bacterium]|nr:MFS transporter [Candidatus Dormibacteraeota bacterium]